MVQADPSKMNVDGESSEGPGSSADENSVEDECGYYFGTAPEAEAAKLQAMADAYHQAVLA